MFITTYTKHKCSECGAIDRTEIVHRKTHNGSEMALRCTGCGHERVAVTTTASTCIEPAVYTLQQKEFEEF